MDVDELVDLLDVMDYKTSETCFKWYSSFFILCSPCVLAGVRNISVFLSEINTFSQLLDVRSPSRSD
jgi:hypothetical protein